MGKSYFSRVFYGCLIKSIFFKVPEDSEEYEVFLDRLKHMGNDNVGIDMVCGLEDVSIFFLFEKETLQKIDERNTNIKEIDLRFGVSHRWNKNLKDFAKIHNIEIKEPKWILTCENW